MAAPRYNVFVGAETGLLKGVDVGKQVWGNLNQLEAVDQQHEIMTMCWAGDDYNEICVGSRNWMVSILHRESLEFTGSCHLPGGEGVFKGLAKVEGCFLTAVDSGLLTLWDEDAKEKKVTIDAGANLDRMRQNPENHQLVATGGKENDLKIWDLQQPDKPVFMAKNVRDDWLQLRVPVWVTDMTFLPGSQKIATVTGHHQLRVYDPSTSQRRPVVDVEFEEYPITSVCARPGYNQVVIGNTQGRMALMDLRKGQVVQCYKGFAGSIRQIECHSVEPVVASVSLDRHLRIHHVETRALLNKFYLKSRLNCVLMTDEWGEAGEDTDQKDGQKSNARTGPEEEDSLWSKMEPLVETPRNNKKSKKNKKLKRPAGSGDCETPVDVVAPKQRKSGKKKKKQGTT